MSRTPPTAPSKAAPPPASKPKESLRDLLDQVAIAFIMAILIKGLEAEAFVIPTGSMAPTLMGRHKEIACPQCGWVYAVNASEDTEEFIRNRQLHQYGICGNCRHRTQIDDTPSFKGDRILVMKFPYELPKLPGSADPKRWDVVVFHYPEKPETNYIKRLVGLPGDDLRLNHGDVQVRPAGTNEAFRIERKPLAHQDAMQMLVYDDRYRPKAFEGKPEWQRWRGPDADPKAESSTGTPAAWSEATPGDYAVEAGGLFSRLGYRHLVPDPDQWDAALAGSTIPRAPRATLITDFYAYNTNISPNYGDLWLQMYEGYLQPNWVGDLTIEGRIDLQSAGAGAALRLELVEAGVANRCEVDLATGTATLYHGETNLGEAPTPLKGVGSHDVRFANVDDRLTLWVDGVTPFGEGLAYDDPGAAYIPTAADLDPVGVAVRGVKARVSGLVLRRDIYYTQNPRDPDYKAAGVYEGIDRNDASPYGRVLKLMDFLGDPARFGEFRDLAAHGAYTVRPGHYLMLGDNSPRSADSRAWGSDDAVWRGDVERSSWEVPRSLLIGKAFFIYWPHGKPFGPDIRLNPDFRIPFRPYFERMRWIR